MSIRESQLAELQVVDTTDYARIVSASGDSRKGTVAALAKTVIENVESSELFGQNQSIQAAFAAVASSIEIDAEVIALYEELGWTP